MESEEYGLTKEKVVYNVNAVTMRVNHIILKHERQQYRYLDSRDTFMTVNCRLYYMLLCIVSAKAFLLLYGYHLLYKSFHLNMYRGLCIENGWSERFNNDIVRY